MKSMPNYKRNNHTFINPYTFIPTPKNRHVDRKALEENCSERPELHTGILKCRLYVKTPLGIPDAEGVSEENGHKAYPFFSYEENGEKFPVIPGSSLRGPLRSVFEAATDSCFSTLRENTGLSRRIGYLEAYMPGILKWANGAWELYEAERYLLAVDPRPINQGGRPVDENYREYGGLRRSTYVNILQRGDVRFARTSNGEELHYGDLVDFLPRGETEIHHGNGHFVWDGVADDIKKLQQGMGTIRGIRIRGLVYIGETVARKKHGESIFVQKGKVNNFSQEDLMKAYQGLLETLEIYQDKAINRNKNPDKKPNRRSDKNHSGYADFEHAKKENGIPVWYSVKDKKFSLASIGRTFYKKTLNDLVGEREPCTERKHLCEACSLFGMAGDESLGSRIRITDAEVKTKYELKPTTLQILGEPRYSYLPFYARTTNARKKVPASYDDDQVEIAGRKFYWHNERSERDPGTYSRVRKDKTNSTMELMMPGAEFEFDIYYDGVTKEQIDKLMWCIHFGENEKSGNLCHKIGHGKPLGLGSVKMVIEEREERKFKNGSYEWDHNMPVMPEMPLRLKNEKALLKVMNFKWLESGSNRDVPPITYPEVYDENGRKPPENAPNDLARHVWYMKNKELRRAPGDETELLPTILSGDQKLHAYQKERDGGAQNHNGNNRNHNNRNFQNQNRKRR